MRYSLELFYVAFTARVFKDLNLKSNTTKAMTPYMASTQFILPLRVSVEILFYTSQMELGISFWTCHNFRLTEGTNSAWNLYIIRQSSWLFQIILEITYNIR